MHSAYSSIAPKPSPKTSRSLRPPIHNPYDKFTQPQFDEWIGGITTALREALGREEHLTSRQKSSAGYVTAANIMTLDDDVYDGVEDSFADLKARREKVLGKMRAVDTDAGDEEDSFAAGVGQSRGFGTSPANPIELLSDGEEEDEASVRQMIWPFSLASECSHISSGSGESIDIPVTSREYQEIHELSSDAQVEEEAMLRHSSSTPDHLNLPVESFTRDGHHKRRASQISSSYSRPFGESVSEQPSEIRDPWELPKLFADDLCTGGDFSTFDISAFSPSHLTLDDEKKYPLQLYDTGEMVRTPHSSSDDADDHPKARTPTGIVNVSSSVGVLVEDKWDEANVNYQQRDERVEGSTRTIPKSDIPANVKQPGDHSPTHSHRPSSPIFTLNDRVDWNTPSFDDRNFHVATIHDDVESESEASSGEEGKSYAMEIIRLHTGTGDVDAEFLAENDELDEYEEDDRVFANTGMYQLQDPSHADERNDVNDVDERNVLVDERQTLEPKPDMIDGQGHVTINMDMQALADDQAHLERKIISLPFDIQESVNDPNPVFGQSKISKHIPLSATNPNSDQSTHIKEQETFSQRSTSDKVNGNENNANNVAIGGHESIPVHTRECSKGLASAVSDDPTCAKAGGVADNDFIMIPDAIQDQPGDIDSPPTPELKIAGIIEEELHQNTDSTGASNANSDSVSVEGMVVNEGMSGFYTNISPTNIQGSPKTTGDERTVEYSVDALAQKDTTPISEIEIRVLSQSELADEQPSPFDSMEPDIPRYLVLEPDYPDLETCDITAEILSTHDGDLNLPISYIVEEPCEAKSDLELDALRSTVAEGFQVVHDRGASVSSALPFDFIMPIIANPDVRDPTSLSHTPSPSVSSQPEVPLSPSSSSLLTVSSSIAKFMDENHLSAKAVHGPSGLFTPDDEENLGDSSGTDPMPSEEAKPVELDLPVLAVTSVGGDVFDLVTPVDELCAEYVKEIADLLQDGGGSTSVVPPDTTTFSDSLSGRNQAIDTGEDLVDLELSYPDTDSAHPEDPQPLVGDRAIDGLPNAAFTVKVGGIGLNGESDNIANDLVDDTAADTNQIEGKPMIENNGAEVTSGEAGNTSAFTDSEKIVASNVVNPEEGLGSPLENLTTDKETRSAPETVAKHEKVIPDAQVLGTDNNLAAGVVDGQLTDPSSSTEASTSVKGAEMVDKHKHLKRKRSSSFRGSSALTRSVSQGNLRTYGRRPHDTGKETCALGSDGAHAFQQDRPGLPSEFVGQEEHEDLPMIHGHGKLNKIKEAIKFRRQMEELYAAELKAAASLEETEYPRKTPPVLSISVPSPQPSSLWNSPSITASPISPLSTVALTDHPHASSTPASPTPVSQPKSISHHSSPSHTSVSRRSSTRQRALAPKSTSTRSHCRYRRISLQKENDGPRVTFCVPQCSLNNKELMTEEKITDDGPATYKDYDKLVEHVDTLDIDPFVIGVLKLLVGVDLLRENEIYYLPQEGEMITRKTVIGKAKSSIKGYKRNTDSPLMSPVAGASGKSAAPLSYTGSTSSSLRPDSNHSISDDELSDKFNFPPTKRRRRIYEAEAGDDDSARALLTQRRKSIRAFKKGLSYDAQNYEPDLEQEHGGEGEDDEFPKSKRRKTTRRGLKRNRTDDDAKNDSSPLKESGVKPKKVKLVRRDTHDI